MEKNRLTVIVFITIVVAFALIIFLYNNGGKKLTQDVYPSMYKDDEVVILEDYNLFFSLNDIINKYYQNIFFGNNDENFNLLDDNYKKKNDITSNNISKVWKDVEGENTYYAKKIYVSKKNNILYYFINGERYEFIMDKGIYEKKENDSFLLLEDLKTKSYSITPLNSGKDIHNFAISYNKKEKLNITKNEYNNFILTEYGTEAIIKLYISYYQNLLYNDKEKAYELLSDDMKVKYSSFEYFQVSKKEIEKIVSSKIFAYSTKVEDNYKLFEVQLINGAIITFKEKDIMNFKLQIDM